MPEIGIAQFTGQRERILRYSTSLGPATCGCVALFHFGRESMTYDYLRRENFPAWPLCPVCKGSGVDPRLKETYGTG